MALFVSSCDEAHYNTQTEHIPKMNSSPSDPTDSFHQLLNSLDDFRLSSCVSGAVDAKYGYEEVVMFSERIPLKHRVVGYVWLVTGGLQNGGYSRLYTVECNVDAFPVCLRAIGLNQLSEIVARSLDLVPADVRGVEGAVIEYFGSRDKFQNKIKSAEDSFFNESQSILDAHANYIRMNADSFEVLYPEIKARLELMDSWERGR